jgi:hypothetical protein
VRDALPGWRLAHLQDLHALATALIDRETLNRGEIEAILGMKKETPALPPASGKGKQPKLAGASAAESAEAEPRELALSEDP